MKNVLRTSSKHLYLQNFPHAQNHESFQTSQTRVKISKILASIAYKIFFLCKKRVSVKNISKKCHTMKRRINMVVTLLKIY